VTVSDFDSTQRPEERVEVEALRDADGVAVRHSGQPDGPVLVYPAQAWEEFLAGAKNGEFDLELLAGRRR
jgi:hypothetical protein